MKNNILFSLIFLLLTTNLFGQEEDGKYFEIGIETQQYPTGLLLGGRAELGLAPKHALELRLGYNILDHEDHGKHDNEEGGGFGFTLGYRYYFKSENDKWFIGVRTDLWFNEVDWFEFEFAAITQGTTNVTVLQPTAIAGYRWAFNESIAITPTLAFGAEINIITDGEAVGEGAIFLWGINLTYRL